MKKYYKFELDMIVANVLAISLMVGIFVYFIEIFIFTLIYYMRYFMVLDILYLLRIERVLSMVVF